MMRIDVWGAGGEHQWCISNGTAKVTGRTCTTRKGAIAAAERMVRAIHRSIIANANDDPLKFERVTADGGYTTRIYWQ